jgi:xanthine dehydrogenase YagS FAD-binding subunit
MHLFTYQRAGDLMEAVSGAQAASSDRRPPNEADSQFIAGGTNMTDYMKLGVVQPETLIDINGLATEGLGEIRTSASGIRFGALARMSEAASNQVIRRDYPVIADTLTLAASQQIRNMASLAGNILQRTRCDYFRETSWPCNKREPGSGCSALEGVNREHAILGVSDACIATYHGDFAQSLIALDATVRTISDGGAKTIAFGDLHRMPGATPNIETALQAGELITHIEVPAGPHTRRSRYVKIRDRQSYQFALASAAIALDLEGDRVRDVRIALGGVATVPWRARDAENELRGKPLDENAAIRAADIAFNDAKPREHNKFKVELGKQTLVRALIETRDMQV